jgi:glucose/arabinose dehydrogenase
VAFAPLCSGSLEAGFVREFPTLPRVEDIAITDDGRFFYVTDEDEGVHLRLTRLLAGKPDSYP